MYINIKDFLINENIKQMRQYLAKNNITDLEPSLDFIKEKFKKKPNYIYIFTKIMVGEDGVIHGSKEQFNDVADWITNRGHLVDKLPKKVQDYSSIEELQDDIRRIDLKELSSKYYKSLYPQMIEEVKALSPSDRTEMDTVVVSFMLLDKAIRNTFPPLIHFINNQLSIHNLKDALVNFVESGEVNSSKSGVLSVIEGSNKATVVYNTDNILIIQTNDRELVLKLGSQRWCIIYAPDSYFDGYVGGANLYAQFICFNFNLPQSNRYSTFGISLTLDGKAVRGGCQDRENIPLPLESVCVHLGVPGNIFTNPYNKVVSDLSQSSDILMDSMKLKEKYGDKLSEAIRGQSQIIKSIKSEIDKIVTKLVQSDDIETELDILNQKYDKSIMSSFRINSLVQEIHQKQIRDIIETSNNTISTILELQKKYDDNTLIKILDDTKIDDRIIEQLEARLLKTSPDLFSGAFNLYDYLVDLDLDFGIEFELYSPEMIIYSKVLICTYHATQNTGNGVEEYQSYLNEFLGEDGMVNFLETAIPEDYYEYPQEFESYTDIIEAFGSDNFKPDETAFNYIIFNNTKRGTLLNKVYGDRLTKALDLDNSYLSNYIIGDFSDLEYMFTSDLDTITDGDLFYEYDQESWSDHLDFSIKTILHLYEILMDDGNIDMDHIDAYNRLKESDYANSNYSKTREVRGMEDIGADVKTLDNYIIEIIEEPEEYDAEDIVESIRDGISDAANQTYRDALSDSYFNSFLSELGDIFTEQIDENGKSVIYTRTTDDKILLKYDVLDFLNKDEDHLSEIVNEHGDEFSTEGVIEYHIDQIGKLDINGDDYPSIDDDDFNDLIIEVI